MKQRSALNLMLGLIGGIILFHLAIILKLIPYDITWGGRLKNDAEMYAFEALSIGLNLVLGFALLIKAGYLRQILPIRVIHIILWGFLVLFALNTIGNVFAETKFEKGFAVLTLAFVVLLGIILLDKKSTQVNSPRMEPND